MSSSEIAVRSPARRLASAALVLTLALGLGGCLRPLYADGTTAVTGGSVKDNLAAIDVAPIADRTGHYLRNELVFDLDGSGQDKPKRYRLVVTVSEGLGVTVTDYSTATADSATLALNATYTLAELATGKVLALGTAAARTTYDRSTQRFANLRAARDAQIRGAKELSGIIRNRLAAGFAGGF